MSENLDFGPPKDRRPVRNPLRVRGRTPGERFLRAMLLIAVFAGVAMLFNRHFERSMELIVAGQSISDQTGRMTAEDKRYARNFGRALKERYGLDFRLRAGQGAAALPADLPPRTLYVGLDPTSGGATLLLPPLLGRAIGDGFEQELAAKLRAASATETWPETVISTLSDLWLRLMQVEAEEAGRERKPPPNAESDPQAEPDGAPSDDNDAGTSGAAPQPWPAGQPGEGPKQSPFSRDEDPRPFSFKAKSASGALVERTGQDDPEDKR